MDIKETVSRIELQKLKETYDQIIVQLVARLSNDMNPDRIQNIHIRYDGAKSEMGRTIFGILDIVQMDNYNRLNIIDIEVGFYLERKDKGIIPE